MARTTIISISELELSPHELTTQPAMIASSQAYTSFKRYLCASLGQLLLPRLDQDREWRSVTILAAHFPSRNSFARSFFTTNPWSSEGNQEHIWYRLPYCLGHCVTLNDTEQRSFSCYLIVSLAARDIVRRIPCWGSRIKTFDLPGPAAQLANSKTNHIHLPHMTVNRN